MALVLEGQKTQLLKPKQEDLWSLTAEIPATTAPGEYTVWVHNGNGGPAGWAKKFLTSSTLAKKVHSSWS